MRIGIREQLAVVVLLAVLITLAIVSIPVWFVVNGFIGDVKAQALALTASLKAAQVASVLNQLQVISNSMTTRISLQNVLNAAYNGSDTAAQWADAVRFLDSTALGLSISNWVLVKRRPNRTGSKRLCRSAAGSRV